MSVFKRKDVAWPGSEVFHYEFQLGGRRFRGSTYETSERRAKAVEKDARVAADRQLRLEAEAGGAPWTFGRAKIHYVNEVLGGELTPSFRSILTWLGREVPAGTPLTTINTAFMLQLTAKRSHDAGKKEGSRVTNATVNRTVLEPMRQILRHAEHAHEKPVGKVDWKRIRRKESSVRIRELKVTEEEKLFAALRPDYHPIIRFHIVTGVRLFESCGLRWKDVDFENRKILIDGKGDTRLPLPMPPSVHEILWPLRDHHPEVVFTYVTSRNRPGGTATDATPQVAGIRRPITYEGLKTMFRRKRDLAGIIDFHFHDLRHTAASRILRRSRNLKAVQDILRHNDIKTTMRYVHIMDEDLSDAMEAGSSVMRPENAQSPHISPPNGGQSRKPE